MNGAGMAVTMGQARMDGKLYYIVYLIRNSNTSTSILACRHAYGDGPAALRCTTAAPPSLAAAAAAPPPVAGAPDALHRQYEQRSIFSRHQYLRFRHPSSKHRRR